MTQEEKWKGQMVRYGLERWGPGRKRACSFHVLSITHTLPHQHLDVFTDPEALQSPIIYGFYGCSVTQA